MKTRKPPERDGAPRAYSCIIIDDDQWAILDIKNIMHFEEMGFFVTGEYSNAADALRAIRETQPALVLSDICLGGESGLDLIEHCRRDGFQGEFILISGYSEFEYARKAIRSDVSTYLLKPIDGAEAQAALQKVKGKLEGRRQPPDERQHVIEQIRDYIRENYQKRLSLDDVADTFFINRTYLSELFREKFGKNFVQFKNEVRVEHAKILLSDTQASISEISAQCGFDNTSYFAMVFKQITGQSPGQYRSCKQAQ